VGETIILAHRTSTAAGSETTQAKGSGALIIRVEPADRARSPTAPADPTAALSLRDLDRALARISEEHRQVILLIGLEGTSYGEAASILDVPIGTIRSRLSHGRESLRTLMDRREGTEATAVRLSRARCRSADVSSRRLSELSFLISCGRSRVDHHRNRGGCSQGYLRSASASPLSLLAWIERARRTGSCFTRVFLTLDLLVQFRPGEDDVGGQIEPEQQNDDRAQRAIVEKP
jgi:hypothetical protein